MRCTAYGAELILTNGCRTTRRASEAASTTRSSAPSATSRSVAWSSPDKGARTTAYAACALDLRVVRSCPDGSCDHALLYLIGKIESGDASRVRDKLKQHGSGISALTLRSGGGSMYESIKIGTLASELMLDTYAPYYPNNCNAEDKRWGITDAPCTCVSGCFLIWMGGVNCSGIVVGMHRPWDTTGDMGQKTPDEAEKIYDQWIDDLKTYLTKTKLPDAYFSKFVETVRSGDMQMLTNADLLALNHHPSKAERLSNRLWAVDGSTAKRAHSIIPK